MRHSSHFLGSYAGIEARINRPDSDAVSVDTVRAPTADLNMPRDIPCLVPRPKGARQLRHSRGTGQVAAALAYRDARL